MRDSPKPQTSLVTGEVCSWGLLFPARVISFLHSPEREGSLMCDPEIKGKMRCICGAASNWSEDEGEEEHGGYSHILPHLILI